MTRVTDLSAHTAVVSLMLQTQERLQEANEQVASQKVSGEYSGIEERQRLVNLENESAMAERYIRNNDIADIRLNVASDSTEAVRTTIENFENQLQDFRRNDATDVNSISQIQTFAYQSMLEMEAYLNSTADGQYVFSGSKIQQEPVNLGLTSLSAFQSTYDGYQVNYPTTRDAHLSNFEFASDEEKLNATLIDNSNWLTFRRDDDADPNTAPIGSITATGPVFSDFAVGMKFTVSNAGVNNGDYTISSISSDGTKIELVTEAFTDEGAVENIAADLSLNTATINLPDETSLGLAETGLLSFSTVSNTITASIAGAFNDISVGDTIEITGADVNSGSYTIAAKAGDVLTVSTFASVQIVTADGTELTSDDFQNLSFDLENSTVTSSITDAFADMQVGQAFTVSGTGKNDGTYTIASNTGTAITIESNLLTDAGLTSTNPISQFSDEAIIDNLTDEASVAGAIVTLSNGTTLSASASDFTNLSFDEDGDTIVAAGGSPFDGLRAGDTITISGTTSNNGTFTIGTVSSDNRTLNILTSTEALTTDGANAGVTFSLTDGTSLTNANTGNVSFTAPDTMTLGAGFNFETLGLSAGDIFTVTGASNADNNGTFKVASLANNGGTNNELTIQTAPDETITASNGTVYNSGALGNLVFDRTANTVTSASGAAMAALTVGSTFTVANTEFNDGTYTVSANNGTGTVTISAVTYDQAGDIFFQMPVGTEAVFDNTAGASNLQIVTGDGTPVDAFSGLNVGDAVELSGASSVSEFTTEAVVDTLTNEANAAGAIVTLPDGSTLNNTDFTDLSFLAADSTITVGSGAPFSTLSSGDTITISGTGSNDGTYTIGTVNAANTVLNIRTSTNSVSTDANDTNATVLLGDGTTLTNAETGGLSFNNGLGSIDLDNTANWATLGLSVGDSFTITNADTAANNGTYIVSSISNNGATNDRLTIQQTQPEIITLPDNTTINNADFGDLVFDEDSNSLTVENGGSQLLGLNVGDAFTISNSDNNNGTYVVSSISGNTVTTNPIDNNTTLTIASISSDGSTITFNEDLSLSGRDVDGYTITGPDNFSYSAGTQVVFDATNDYIEIQTISNGSSVSGSFSDLRAGMTIDANFTGSNNGTFTISSISSDGSRIYVTEDITTDETDANDAVLSVFATTGTIDAQNTYYQGDQRANTHRLNENNTFEFDYNASDPAFEKAIRAMGIIAQGAFGTAGGLDNEANRSRITEALFLLTDAIDSPAEGDPPYGTEIQTSSITQIEIDIGYRQNLVKTVNEQETSYIAFLQSNISRIENVDELEAITRLLDESRTLEASYQALSRVRQLSLVNFI